MDDERALLTALSGLAMHAIIGRSKTKPDPETVAHDSLSYAIELFNALENHFEDVETE